MNTPKNPGEILSKEFVDLLYEMKRTGSWDALIEAGSPIRKSTVSSWKNDLKGRLKEIVKVVVWLLTTGHIRTLTDTKLPPATLKRIAQHPLYAPPAVAVAVPDKTPDSRPRSFTPATIGPTFHTLAPSTPSAASNLLPVMKRIPGGRFSMGSPFEEEGHEPDQDLQEEEDVAPFLLAAHPVTVRQFLYYCEDSGVPMTSSERAGCCGPTKSGRLWLGEENGIDFAGSHGPTKSRGLWEDNIKFNCWRPGFKQHKDQPVVCVTFQEAIDYCVWLSGMTGKQYGLPTEIQWEFACRGKLLSSGDVEITSDPYHFGKTITPKLANYGGNEKGTTKVDKYDPNGFGLFDMHGNVREMCNSWYPNDQGVGIVRGGSWTQRPQDCRAAFRCRHWRWRREADVGFRVCQSHSEE